jgi:1-acyl-sn-glycerol-3-phosphate acyltransferase
MAPKGVLGNDPFQRGAAKPQAEAPGPVKKAAAKAPKKAPAAKKAAAKAPKAPAAKKAGARKPRTTQAESPVPAATARTAVSPTERPVAAAPPREETRSLVEEPVALRGPGAPSSPGEVLELPVSPAARRTPEEETLRQRMEGAVDAEEAMRTFEAALGGRVDTGPVAVPGFEELEVPPEAVAMVEVLDPSQDEYRPPDELAAQEEARIEMEVEIALAPALPASDGASAFFTAQPSGAESHGKGDRFAEMMSLAKDIALQALSSEQFGRALDSARGLLSATLTGLGVGGGTAIDEYGKDASLVGVLRPVQDFLYERYWRVSVQGASHVPSGPVLLVANHSGALPFDGPMLQLALGRERPDLREARWLVEDQVFYAPGVGTLMNRLGAVRACPENALRLLNELRPVIVFPEGIQGMGKPFAQRYQLKRFGRGGFVKLALRTGAPIVPVAIVGAEETAPLLGKIPATFLGFPYLPVTPPPLPARWTIRFGDPILMDGFEPEAAEDMSLVQRLTERTRESIQGMLQALLKERRSVFAG